MADYRFEDFEPTAAKAANEAPSNFTITAIAAMSIAISLKRIADTLDSTVVGTMFDNQNAVRIFDAKGIIE
jgi:hypothetical protein